MDPTILTSTVQEFNGHRYYRSQGKPYFQRVVNRHESESLHRKVWEHHHGPIPTKMHVHHKDGDRSNNRLDNLLLLPSAYHLASHMTPARRRAQAALILKTAVPAARAWHKSTAGRAWHSRHAKQSMAKRTMPRPAICQECGKPFTARCIQPAKYCSPQCNWKAQGRRKRARKRAASQQ